MFLDTKKLTIPSGIVMTDARCAADILNKTDKIFWTTKSIGPRPRIVPTEKELKNKPTNVDFANREPILYQYAPGCWGNAVGLANPGPDYFRQSIISSRIPKEKINASIFGKDAAEFICVAKNLEDVVGSFELNFSCPHAQGHGLAVGQDLNLVAEIVKELRANSHHPLIGKIGHINAPATAKTIIENGGNGVTLINTAGPGLYLDSYGSPILYNPAGNLGGMSGSGIFPLALRAVKETREAIGKNHLIIASGGISNPNQGRIMKAAGANVISIGSALAGMTNDEVAEFLETFYHDMEKGTNNCEKLLKSIDMKYTEYKKVKITRVIRDACDLGVYKTDISLDAGPGQFVFARIPGVGEKPFSVMDNEPLTLGVLNRGYFTQRFNQLREGDLFDIRGPYGKTIDVPSGSEVTLVGGGCGIAGIYLPAKKFSEKANLTIMLGTRDKERLAGFHELERFGELRIATEDGSYGQKGMVNTLLKDLKQGTYFFNCGPSAMVESVLPIEMKYSPGEKIYSSLDYLTMCGVGICGRCSDNKGRRTCVEGPFMSP